MLLPLAALLLPLTTTALGHGWQLGAALFLTWYLCEWWVASRAVDGVANEHRLHRQGALVIGAASGLGRDISRELARCGARLELWDVHQAGLDAVVAELHAQYGMAGQGGLLEVQATVVDITDAAAVAKGIKEADARFAAGVDAANGGGGLQLVVNSAGLMVGRPLAVLGSGSGSTTSAAGQQQPSSEQLRAVLQVNALGPLLVAREVLPCMLRRGGPGLLVTVGSVMGLVGAAGLAVPPAPRPPPSLSICTRQLQVHPRIC